MNLKKIIAVAALACASAASASTNYVEVAAKGHSLVLAVREMAKDPALAEPDAFRAALEDLDRSAATGGVRLAYRGVSWRCPLTARAVVGRCRFLSERARADVLAVCGYDAANRSPYLRPHEAGYANFILQAACGGIATAAGARSGVLAAAIAPARRRVRAESGTFVGDEAAKRVKETLDELAAELNAPRFGKAGEILARLGMDVEWEFVRSRILTDDEVASLCKRLLDGEIPFGLAAQSKLCVALGVDAYNAFVREYNGESKK